MPVETIHSSFSFEMSNNEQIEQNHKNDHKMANIVMFNGHNVSPEKREKKLNTEIQFDE